MKVLIVSDTHNKHGNLFKIFRKETFDAVIFLGDVEHGEEAVRKELENRHPLCPIKFVKGNCDDFSKADVSAVAAYDGVKVFMTHGHHFAVRFGRESLAEKALEEGCSIALFGHLHLPIKEEVLGITCFNPGSVGEPRNEDKRATYGMLETENGEIKKLIHKYVDEL